LEYSKKTQISVFCKHQKDTFTFSSQKDYIQICYVDPLMALLANDIQIQMAPIYQFLEVECESCVAP